MTPVFGHGIFNQDGKGWERSRALVRPNFTRQQVADLDMFEEHVGHLSIQSHVTALLSIYRIFSLP